MDDVNLRALHFVNPIMGVSDSSFSSEAVNNCSKIVQSLWSTCGEVLIADILRLRAVAAPSSDERAHEEHMSAALDRLGVIMATYSDGCPFICKRFHALPGRTLIYNSCRLAVQEAGTQTP